MQPHPDPHRLPARPVVPGQCPLHFQRAQHRLLRPAERYKERIPLRIHLTAAMRRDRPPDQPPVSASTSGYRSRSALTSCVDPSMSLNSIVTVPVGSSLTSRLSPSTGHPLAAPTQA